MKTPLTLLSHPTDAPSAFTPEALLEAVRTERGLSGEEIPAVCVLEFDGDLTDSLVTGGIARPFKDWACFHTTMFALATSSIRSKSHSRLDVC